MLCHIKPILQVIRLAIRHTGFLFTLSGIGKYNKMSRYISLSSYHDTKLQLSDKNIITHTGLSHTQFEFFL